MFAETGQNFDERHEQACLSSINFKQYKLEETQPTQNMVRLSKDRESWVKTPSRTRNAPGD
jgi:hypothetical protein